MSKISPIIQPNELIKLDLNKVILFDASAGSRERYNQKHLAGAFYIDLDRDLANIGDFAKGGRHPLPSPEDFTNTLGNFGVEPDSHIIIYDDKNGSNAAARFWWMMKAIGHEKVQVINGGLDAAIKAGFPTNSEKPVAKSAVPYEVYSYQLPLAEINEVEKASKAGDQLIVDVRSIERFNGLTEPIDLIAGHIPNAINIPFTENLDAEGLFLAPETLNEKYKTALADADHTIVHCGSGVTACHLLLALDYAGLKIPKLYIGSWSEWSRNGKAMVTSKSQDD